MPKTQDKKTEARKVNFGCGCPGVGGTDVETEYGSEISPIDVNKETKAKNKQKGQC